MSEIFSDLHAMSKFLNERNDCTVKALSVVTGMSYADSHAILKKHGRRNRGGTNQFIVFAALKELGIEYDHNFIPHDRTVNQFGKNPRNKGTYLILTRGHILGARDGKVHDWTAGRKHRINSVIEILNQPTLTKKEEKTMMTKSTKTTTTKTAKSLTAKETIYRLWKRAPKKTKTMAEELSKKHGVKFSSVKTWISMWANGYGFPKSVNS